MRPPAFWDFPAGRWPAALLAPFGVLTAAATARRVARPGWRAPVPVLCCGNATVGGAGKTILALEIAHRLKARGKHPAFLTRGYGGGSSRHPLQVTGDAGENVGDEARLLAEVAPTFVAADRAAAARAALKNGADILVMDDGLQNPTLEKSFSFLVIDGAAGFGNCLLLPAGPLREPIAAAAARCRAAILIGPDRTGALLRLPQQLPILRASLQSHYDPEKFAEGKPLAAFAGIGRPEKFFASLEARGAKLALRQNFPDHHRYTDGDLAPLLAAADRLGAVPVTTPKDFVRLPPNVSDKIHAIGVDLIWDDAHAITALLEEIAAR